MMSGRWTLFVWKGKVGIGDASFVLRTRGRSLDEKCLTASVLQFEWIVRSSFYRVCIDLSGGTVPNHYKQTHPAINNT